MATDNNNIDTEMLKKAVTMMATALGMTGIGAASSRSSAYERYNSENRNPRSASSDKIKTPNYDKLNNIIKNNGDSIQQMTLAMKNLSKRGGVLNDLYDELNKTTKHLNDTQRKAAIALADNIAKNAKKSSDAMAALEQLTKSAEKVSASMQKSQVILKSLDDINKEIQARKDEIAKLKRSKKKGSSAKVKSEQSALDDLIKKQQQLDAEYQSAINTIENFNNKIGALSKEEIEHLKNLKDINKEERKTPDIFEKLNDGIQGVHEGSKIAANNIVKNSTRLGSAFDKLGRGLKIFGTILANVAPQLARDIMARQSANISGTEYLSDISRGISETDRAQLISQNRLQFRALGQGNETQGFANSAELQKTAHLFGVYGREAIQKALQYQQTTGGMGISYSNVKATQTQMSFMRDFAKQIGATDDQLKDFYDSLQDSGELAVLSAKNANKSEEERQKAINQEIYTRTKLNTVLGFSIDQQKQLQQQAINQRYAGIEDIIRRQLGASMQVSMYNRRNPNDKISDEDKNFYASVQAAGGIDTLTDEKSQKRFGEIAEKINVADMAALKNAQETAANNRNLSPMLQESLYTKMLGNFGINRQEENRLYGTAAQRQAAQGKYAVDTSKDFDSTLKTAAENLDGPDKFTEAVIRATEALHGFSNSPFGGNGGIASTIGSIVAGAVASKVIGKGATVLGGKIGGKLGKIISLFGDGAEGVKAAEKVGEKAGTKTAEKVGEKVGAKTAGESVIKTAGKGFFGSIFGNFGGEEAKTGEKVGEKAGTKTAGEAVTKIAGKGFFSSIFGKAGEEGAKTAGETATKTTGKGFLGSIFGKSGEEGAKTAGETATKTTGKGFLGSIFGKVGGEEGVKAAEKVGEKAVGKTILKKIPLVSLLAGLGFGAYRAYHGDWAGAGEEVASGALGSVPVIGTAASLGLDAHLAYKDYKNSINQALPNNLSASDIGKMFTDSLTGTQSLPPSPNDLLRQQLDQVQALMQNGGSKDKIQELLEGIYKTNKEMNDRDSKNDQKQQLEEAAQTGSVYASYRKHLDEVQSSIRH